MAKKRYAGGANEKPDLSYGNKDVVREAEERKKGGKVPPRLDKRRWTGGRSGSDSSPLSSANKARKAP